MNKQKNVRRQAYKWTTDGQIHRQIERVNTAMQNLREGVLTLKGKG